MEEDTKNQLARIAFRIANRQKRLADLVDDPTAIELIKETLLEVAGMMQLLEEKQGQDQH